MRGSFYFKRAAAALVVLIVLSTAGGLVQARELNPGPVAGGRAAKGSGQPVIVLPVCVQHPQVCPVDEATWQGEAGGWQRTGRTWVRHSDTQGSYPDYSVIWQWSEPYNGPVAEYAGHRQNPYADYSANPFGMPGDGGPAPPIYDWERWQPDGDNWRLYQYGRNSEQTNLVGDTDCESGVNYPVVDAAHPYAYTPLHVERLGECVGGGYLATFLAEEWGAPRSAERRQRCDNPISGIRASENATGNLLCNLSPNVGVIYQVYMFQAGPYPEDFPIAGCEAVVTAWGWPAPAKAQNTAQDWQTWFRNGELRWSYWGFVSSTETPPPSDFDWWSEHCSPIFLTLTNWVYGGGYLLGSQRYTDTLTLPATFTGLVPTGGVVLTSTLDGVSLDAPAGTFTATARLTQTVRLSGDVPPTGELAAANFWFEWQAADAATGLPLALAGPVTLTLTYSDAALAGIIEDTLALYRRAGDNWTPEPNFNLNLNTNTLTVTVSALGQWALLGQTNRVYLPSASAP
jgi:hypothetical protein